MCFFYIFCTFPLKLDLAILDYHTVFNGQMRFWTQDIYYGDHLYDSRAGTSGALFTYDDYPSVRANIGRG